MIRAVASARVATAAIAGCVNSPTVLAPSCAFPAELEGSFDHRAPGYIVAIHPPAKDSSSAQRKTSAQRALERQEAIDTIEMLADKYDLTLTARYDYSVYGFAVRVLKPEVLAALRCEPAIKHVSYNQVVHVTQSRSWPPNNSLQADKVAELSC